jgi:general secretion pathway protein B
MSYILEGLKKLEEKRKQEEKLPHSLAFTFQTDNAVKPPRSSIWSYLLVALLLLNAGVIIWWIAPWRSHESSIPAVRGSLQKTVPAESSSSAVEQKNRIRPDPAGKPTPKKITDVPPLNTSGKETKNMPLPATKETQTSKQQPSAVPAVPEQSKPPANGRIVRLNELPSDILKSLPDLKMSAHFYSADHQARFARVNDRILHEGETSSEGLKVEEINANGTVFNYKGWRFQVGINENR